MRVEHPGCCQENVKDRTHHTLQDRERYLSISPASVIYYSSEPRLELCSMRCLSSHLIVLENTRSLFPKHDDFVRIRLQLTPFSEYHSMSCIQVWI